MVVAFEPRLLLVPRISGRPQSLYGLMALLLVATLGILRLTTIPLKQVGTR